MTDWAKAQVAFDCSSRNIASDPYATSLNVLCNYPLLFLYSLLTPRSLVVTGYVQLRAAKSWIFGSMGDGGGGRVSRMSAILILTVFS